MGRLVIVLRPLRRHQDPVIAASSAASRHAPGHHAKGVHGASYYAPGRVEKRKGLQSARTVAPGSYDGSTGLV
jgi:hypothetical protein